MSDSASPCELDLNQDEINQTDLLYISDHSRNFSHGNSLGISTMLPMTGQGLGPGGRDSRDRRHLVATIHTTARTSTKTSWFMLRRHSHSLHWGDYILYSWGESMGFRHYENCKVAVMGRQMWLFSFQMWSGPSSMTKSESEPRPLINIIRCAHHRQKHPSIIRFMLIRQMTS